MDAPQLEKRRWQLILAVTSLTTGGFIFSAREEMYFNWGISVSIVLALAWGLGGVGLASILLYYLRGDLGPERRRRQAEEREAFQTLVVHVAELRQQMDETTLLSAAPSDEDRATIRLNLREELLTDVTRRFETKYSATASDSDRLLHVRRNFEAATNRLRQEMSVLDRRANLNLVIGALVTMVAITGLLSLLTPTSEEPSWQHLLEYYLPRIGTVVLVEVFAFFFLKLYKSNLTEIKYYQNEITSLTLHWNAFEAAGLTIVPTSVLEHFARADRNFPGHSPTPKSTELQVDAKLLGEILQKAAETVVKPTA